MKVAVSILSTPYSDAEAIEKVNNTDAEYLHVDVLDGHFVPNVKREYRDLHLSTKPLDVHLMVSNPFTYISKYAYKTTEYITLSSEIGENLDDCLDYIKNLGLKCGLALKPSSGIDSIRPYLSKLDKIIVLTVEPGASHQKMLKGSLYRIEELESARREGGYSYEIWVDGGVNAETISKVSDADGVVSGGFVTSGENFQERIDTLRLLKNT